VAKPESCEVLRYARSTQCLGSETIIGNWLKKSGKRGDVVIAMKVGTAMGEEKQGLSAGYIKRAVEDSLRRLQTDCIDMYQAHRDDANTPLAETMGAFTELLRQGKVRAIGASNYSGQRLTEALEVSTQEKLAGTDPPTRIQSLRSFGV
jgi:aryl-alcohol dehydrogenase-like predicted oxidoreductase